MHEPRVGCFVCYRTIHWSSPAIDCRQPFTLKIVAGMDDLGPALEVTLCQRCKNRVIGWMKNRQEEHKQAGGLDAD